ncbi:MAG: hypothetical protein HQL26_00145 [Candidatus Omnitrophica bacterium]|nr:hypothetical protein [Candidatus Omnitrophota bacterium]
MKSFGYVLLVAVILTGGVKQVWADNVASMEERLQALEQEVAILKRQIEIDKEESSKKLETVPIVTVGIKDGLQIKTPDESYKLKIGGYVQADARFFANNGNTKELLGTTDTFYARTVRLVFQGTVSKYFDFYIAPEFGSSTISLPDAYAEWRINPAFKIRGGKFKAPFGYDRLESTPALIFAEPALVENLAPNRDLGFQLSGDLWKSTLSYALAVTNGVQDAGGTSTVKDTNNGKEIGGRIVVQPFSNTDLLSLRKLGVAGAFSYGHKEETLSASPAYVTAGQSTFYSLTGTASGAQSRYSPQIFYYFNSLGFWSEYMSSQEQLVKTTKKQKIRNDGWQVAASYVLTGEDASYKGVTPKHPFDLSKGQWGAFEIAGRYSSLDIDNKVFDSNLTSTLITTSAAAAGAWTAGLNWYINNNVKFVLNYEQTKFKGGAVNGSRLTENLILSRLQLAF